ncbi:DUF1345 domain-containing protein [Microbacterium sp. 4R-513]|uniref:DUF1345 domain-containing protein n=1 Tax=Microbacterium sp. 4R-513 TaxID=2567934 RepID=UPI0013E1F622|nr:DUF1345 domain-containing protein [Microbacterium sp. 4R-513]QIG40267.1 DUF1345 domain-containing protein [Microbacterium sp. 4R-513]
MDASIPTHSTVIPRGMAAVAVGLVVGVWLSIVADVWVGILAGWAATSLVAGLWAFTMAWRMDAAQTRTHARAEDPGRSTARVIALVGSLASLFAVAAVLIQTRNVSEIESWILAGLAVVAVAASWFLIQTDYMLRLAAEYYSDPVGGIDFNQTEDPMYSDFAYIALTLGMTYQIGDTNLRTNQLRRIVLAQSALAYLFATVIIATVINLVVDLG